MDSTANNLEASMTPWLPGSDLPGEATLPPSRRVPPPSAGGPPPLPPRRARPKLRPVPLAVSAVSVLVTLLCFIGIVNQFRSKTADAPADPAAAQPAAGVAAERWAAVTIESSGVRLVVIDAKRTPGNAELFLAHATNRAWKLGDVPPGAATPPESIVNLERILAAYGEALKLNGVPDGHLLVACNSGVIQPAANAADRTRIQDWVKAVVRKTMSVEADIVDAGLEAEYGARGSVPPVAAVRRQSVAIDMGGSSTKHGYFDTPTTFKGDKFRIGVRAAETEIGALAKAKRLSFPAAAREWKTATADDAVRKLAEESPPLRNHPRCYLLGGAPWAVTVFTHPAEFAKSVDERPVDIRLTPADIDAALKLLEDSPNFTTLTATVIARVPAGPGREHLTAELDSVGTAFRTEQLVAGATLLKSFADVYQYEGKEVRFYTRSLHAWPVGYILVKGKFEL